MENLNKENFWNEMQKKYPNAMGEFCNWIDIYKKENNWDSLFNAGLMVPIRGQSVAPKFHDLPLAMQMGIINEFINRNSPNYKHDNISYCKRDIEHYLKGTEEEIESEIGHE